MVERYSVFIDISSSSRNDLFCPLRSYPMDESIALTLLPASVLFGGVLNLKFHFWDAVIREGSSSCDFILEYALLVRIRDVFGIAFPGSLVS